MKASNAPIPWKMQPDAGGEIRRVYLSPDGTTFRSYDGAWNDGPWKFDNRAAHELALTCQPLRERQEERWF